MYNINDLVKKWEAVLKEGKEITSDKVKKATAVMLENQHNFLMEGVTWSGPPGGNDALGAGDGRGISGATYPTSGMFHKIAVPMVRRTFPELVAHQLVGVQPLTGPVGLAFALRFRPGQSVGSYTANVTELGYNTIESTYSGSYITSAGEALGSKAGSGVGSDIGLGVGAGTHIREVNLTVEKTQVEAKTRKLRSRWSLEIAQDLKAMHGLDLEEEMMDILARLHKRLTVNLLRLLTLLYVVSLVTILHGISLQVLKVSKVDGKWRGTENSITTS